jgi:hypothetical protein
MAGDRADAGSWTVIVWNMNEGWHARPQSWAMLDGMKADIFLLNEARVSKDRQGPQVRGGEETLGLDPKPRPWAAAVVSPHGLMDVAADVPTDNDPFAGATRERSTGLLGRRGRAPA